MKIMRIKLKNHPILGDLVLDFTDKNGNPIETIIFVGLNGAGKSTLLAEIQSKIAGDIHCLDYIEYEVDGETYTFRGGSILDSTENQPTADKHLSNFSTSSSGVKVESRIQVTRGNISTSSILDASKFSIDEFINSTAIKQLLIDIITQDNDDFIKEHRSAGIDWKTYEPQSKIYRFSSAFDTFFQDNKSDLTFSGKESVNQDIMIQFEKNNTKIPIESLSAGEKQIINRGAHLLKNQKILTDGVVLIDEPEISMHPMWAKYILQYYKTLFTINGLQQVQLFAATHSDHVLQSVYTDKTKNKIIILDEKNGVINSKAADKDVLRTATFAEINYLAFDLVSTDYHNQLFTELQSMLSTEPYNPTKELSVLKTDGKIKNHSKFTQGYHEKSWTFKRITYKTLPTFIRNAISHPHPNDLNKQFTEDELRISIKLMRDIIQNP